MDDAKNTFLSAGGRDKIRISVAPDLPAAMADRRRIVQVINNLLSNASRRSHSAADDAGDEIVLACLPHDLGHILGQAGEWGLPDHADVAARALQPLLPPARNRRSAQAGSVNT